MVVNKSDSPSAQTVHQITLVKNKIVVMFLYSLVLMGIALVTSVQSVQAVTPPEGCIPCELKVIIVSAEEPTLTPTPTLQPGASPTPTRTPTPTSQIQTTPMPTITQVPGCQDTMPPVPAIYSVTPAGSNAVKLTWTKVTPANSYTILYGPTSNSYLYSALSIGDVDSFTINGISTGCYVMRAINGCAFSNLSPEVCVGTSGKSLATQSTTSDGELLKAGLINPTVVATVVGVVLVGLSFILLL